MRKIDSIIPAPAGHRLFYLDIEKSKLQVEEIPLIGYGLSQYFDDDKELIGFDMVPLSSSSFHNNDILEACEKTLLGSGSQVVVLTPLQVLEEEQAKWEQDAAKHLYNECEERRRQASHRAAFKILLDEGKTIDELLKAFPENWNGKPLTKEMVQAWVDKGMPL